MQHFGQPPGSVGESADSRLTSRRRKAEAGASEVLPERRGEFSNSGKLCEGHR